MKRATFLVAGEACKAIFRNLLSSDRIINKMMLAALWKKMKKKNSRLSNSDNL